MDIEEAKVYLRELKKRYAGKDGEFPDTPEDRDKLIIEILSLIVQFLAS